MRTEAEFQLLETIAAEQARRSFWAYRQFANPNMLKGWWQKDAARHLQQFYEDLIAGKRPKLIIQAPPQHGKSDTIVDFIAWLSGKNPDFRTIYASFSERLGIRANMNLQRDFDEERYQKAFPDLKISQAGPGNYGPALRNREIIEFIGRKGYFRNTTIGGSVTGESLDLAVLDDPIKGREEANSETVRDKAWLWLTDDFLTRFSDNAGLLCILTRWHLDDPAGRLIKANPDVKVVAYPAIAEENDGRSEIDQANRDPGEPLFPELKSLEFLQGVKATMDPGSWESLYQQRPVVAGGNLFKIEQFQTHRHGEERPYKRRIITADTAQKTGERNDYSVFQCWGLGKDGIAYLIDQARGKFEAPELEKVARAFWAKHSARNGGDQGNLSAMYVEDKTSGTGLIQQLGRGEDRVPVRPVQRSTDKYSRALDAIPSIAAGNVSVPHDAPWSKDFFAELLAFPNGTHDDQVDPLMDGITQLFFGSTYDLANLSEGLERIMAGAGGAHAMVRQRYLGY
jgi:predicted phage terminase large subunit-like protein